MLAEGIGWMSLIIGGLVLAVIVFFEFYCLVAEYFKQIKERSRRLDGFGIDA